MVHLYYGQGKGKTTAAMGLVLRGAGRTMPVAVVQFLKTENSGERNVLRNLENVTLFPVPKTMKFIWAMTTEERQGAMQEQCALLNQAAEWGEHHAGGILVLDELCGAVETGIIGADQAMALIDRLNHNLEVVITGREPWDGLMEHVHYATNMENIKHPFQSGQPARIGIEW